MPRIRPFEEHADRYDAWFEKNQLAYRSELEAVKSLMPESSAAVEIAIARGSFDVRAAPIGHRTRAISSSVNPRCESRCLNRPHLRSDPISPR